MASGKWISGGLISLLFVGLFALLGAAAMFSSREDLVALTVDPQSLLYLAIGAVTVASLWLIVAAVSMRHLEPRQLGAGKRIIASTLVFSLSAIVVVPLALGASWAMVQRDLIGDIFTTASGDHPRDEVDGKDEPVTLEDPWADQARVNVLLIGGDGAANREGVRADTNIIVSIDTKTGDAVLISLPRNLKYAPFPEASELAQLYPNGFDLPFEDPAESMLNAVYLNLPSLHPQLFVDSTNPGASAQMLAAEGVTGLEIDNYALVNLKGFQKLVDALGGVDINVQYRIPVGNEHRPDGSCTTPDYYIETGEQHLSGYDTLWYARARCGGEGVTDDYDRMRRQRCVLGAIIEQADPVTVLRRYQALAAATKDIVSTDIPQDYVDDYVNLALRVKDASVTSLPITNKVINTGNPDFDLIQAAVKKALKPKPSATPSATTDATPKATPKPSASATPADESEGAQDLSAVC